MRVPDDLDRLHAHVDELRRAINDGHTSIAVLDQRMRAVENDIRIMSEGAESRFVTMGRFRPVERGVYSVLGILGSVLGGYILAGLLAR